jgi:hypothetical protein
LTDDLVTVFEAQVRPLSEELRTDLLQGSTAGFLTGDLRWVLQAFETAGLEPGTTLAQGAPLLATPTPTRSAYRLGYQQATSFRQQFGVPTEPLDDLAQMLHKHCGWPSDRLTAVVGKRRDGVPQVVGPSANQTSQRFRLARAVYFLPSPDVETPPRLVTRAYTWDQRASRAFAAELLAPAEALRQEVRDHVPQAKVEELARKFRVSPWVIAHQLENHRIGWTEED